jgi:ribosomal-protein-alanine N-acetyltransferase
MTHRIRNAVPGDIAEIMRIEHASFANGIREDRATFLDRIAVCHNCFTVLEGERDNDTGRSTQPSGIQTTGSLAGYLSAEIWDRVPEPTVEMYRLGHPARERHCVAGCVLYISSFAVDPAARGGAGRAFFRGSIERIAKSAPSIERIVFIVHEQWHAARHIYETEGFSYTGTIDGFFHQESIRVIPPHGENRQYGANALIMEKWL